MNRREPSKSHSKWVSRQQWELRLKKAATNRGSVTTSSSGPHRQDQEPPVPSGPWRCPQNGPAPDGPQGELLPGQGPLETSGDSRNQRKWESKTIPERRGRQAGGKGWAPLLLPPPGCLGRGQRGHWWRGEAGQPQMWDGPVSRSRKRQVPPQNPGNQGPRLRKSERPRTSLSIRTGHSLVHLGSGASRCQAAPQGAPSGGSMAPPTDTCLEVSGGRWVGRPLTKRRPGPRSQVCKARTAGAWGRTSSPQRPARQGGAERRGKDTGGSRKLNRTRRGREPGGPPQETWEDRGSPLS